MDKITGIAVGFFGFFAVLMFLSFIYAWFNNMLLIKHLTIKEYKQNIKSVGYFKYIYTDEQNDKITGFKIKVRKGLKFSVMFMAGVIISVIVIALFVRKMHYSV